MRSTRIWPMAASHYESEHRILHRDRTYRWVRCRGAAIRNAAGMATRLAGSLTDVTDSKVADALTGLPNRVLFVELLEQAIRRRRATPELPVRPPHPRSGSVQAR